MDEKPGDILTIEELSTYLKIPKSTLSMLVREGKVPCQKIGCHWRFLKKAIDAVASIRPREAGMVLADLSDSEDDEILEAVYEAIGFAEALSDDEFDEDELVE